MGTIAFGSFAESTVGNFKVNNTGVATATGSGVRNDVYVSPTIDKNLAGADITATVTVSGVGDKGTAATAATASFTFDPADGAWTAATKVDAIDCATLPNSSTARVTINVPTAALGDGTNHVFQACNDLDGSTSASDGVGGIGTASSSASTMAEAIVDFINGVTNSRVHFGSGTTIGGIQGVTASLGTGGTKVTLTADAKGAVGNDITIANTAGSIATAGNLAGGTVTAPSDAYIELISTSGRKVKYTPVATDAEADAFLNKFSLGINATQAAGNLETLIENASKGHGAAAHQIIVSRTYGAISLTQGIAGAAGNTVIGMGGNIGAYFSVNPNTNFEGGTDRRKVGVYMQLSNDGINWSDKNNSVKLIDDLDGETTGTYVGLSADLPSVPYYRIAINPDGDVNLNGAGNTFAAAVGYSYKFN